MRQKILEQAIYLFCEFSFETVTISDIAKATETTPVEVYNHFSGKNDILDNIYAFYRDVIMSRRLTEPEYMPILRDGSAKEILGIFDYPLPEPISYHFCVIKIIWARRFTDMKAREVYIEQAYHAAQDFIHEVLRKGIAIGRLDMEDSEIETVANMIHAIREYAANTAVIEPDHTRWLAIEGNMMEKLAGMIRLRDGKKETKQVVNVDMDAAVREAIQNDSLMSGRYYHYLCEAGRRGDRELAAIIREVMQNVLDELDALYLYSGNGGGEINERAICEHIVAHEAQKQLMAKDKIIDDGQGAGQILMDIVDLAAQHERIFRDQLKRFP
ncbi:MAG: TetR family transcriptional regulator [Oscillospiraceae bacterium]|jgi:AcrR family transcriptional regulator|nr:TetR family transcriptional regulator [Oscillospiraceae bacterium]